MLVHECAECGALSINRIAADDDPASVMDVFSESRSLDFQFQIKCEEQGIRIANDMKKVHTQLYGRYTKTLALEW